MPASREVSRPRGSRGKNASRLADPRAELLIDDVVLYDAAAPEEKRPFPKRIVFTAWFDTGKQGQEWPGDFKIVAHEPPLKWKAAKSVMNKDSGSPWIRLSLRGLRQLPERTHVRFKHRLSSEGTIDVSLANSKTGVLQTQKCASSKANEWAESNVAFAIKPDPSRSNQTSGGAGVQIDEIHFKPRNGATLLIDDVLVYEPSEE